jgi:hypothetical protein
VLVPGMDSEIICKKRVASHLGNGSVRPNLAALKGEANSRDSMFQNFICLTLRRLFYGRRTHSCTRL